MNTQRNTPPTTRQPGGSEAGGQQEGLRHPVDDEQRVKQRLDDVGLDDQGDVADDQLRDRRSSGSPSSDNANSKDARRH
ncbi:hypothetical protein [Lysobacter sp. Root494]|uniref:hypothetical protein n=1 Tax=Lysobacter sp. Root494 TaxID=1736549 RepID=UPI0006F5C446|nr:hypothetical protein [Lysobacter sp. Root494]KQY52232.1 hypothetical protein ASD14_06210 [Lysobacter sp. Root494]